MRLAQEYQAGRHSVTQKKKEGEKRGAGKDPAKSFKKTENWAT